MELFSKPRARLPRLAVLLGGMALLATVTAVARADCGIAWTLGSASSGSWVTSSKNDDRDGTRNLDCPDGSYVRTVSLKGAHWGTYPSITYVTLICRSPSGTASENSLGRDYVTSSPSGGSGGSEACNGAYGALLGLKVSAESYIRDLKLRCGGIGADTSIDDRGWEGGWLLGHQSSSTSSISCGGSSVVSGLRLSYRDDGDEYAFTKVQLRCSRVRPPDTYAPTLSGSTRQAFVPSFTVVVRASCPSPCELEATGTIDLPSGERVGLGYERPGCIDADDPTRLELTLSTGDVRQRVQAALRRSGGLTATITLTAEYTTGTVRTVSRDITLYAPRRPGTPGPG